MSPAATFLRLQTQTGKFFPCVFFHHRPTRRTLTASWRRNPLGEIFLAAHTHTHTHTHTNTRMHIRSTHTLAVLHILPYSPTHLVLFLTSTQQRRREENSESQLDVSAFASSRERIKSTRCKQQCQGDD